MIDIQKAAHLYETTEMPIRGHVIEINMERMLQNTADYKELQRGMLNDAFQFQKEFNLITEYIEFLMNKLTWKGGGLRDRFI